MTVTRPPSSNSVDALIAEVERNGLGWDIGNTGALRECRIWRWPNVVGRYRFEAGESLFDVMRYALADHEKNKDILA